MKRKITIVWFCLFWVITVFGQADVKECFKDTCRHFVGDNQMVLSIYPKKYVGARLMITGDELRRAGNTNVINSLKNIDPSFMRMENLKMGSDPNVFPEIQMYGQTGLSNVQPLFILDGFEVSLYRVMNLDLQFIDKVVVLKSAVDKSRYGAKGGQGVIEIYTIRPMEGKVNVRYYGNIDIQSADLSSYNLCNAREKLEAEMLAGYGAFEKKADAAMIPLDARYVDLMKKVDEGLNTDWLSLPLRESIGHKHSLYVNGGLDKFSYGVNLYYNNAEGVMKGSDKRIMDGNLFLAYDFKKLRITNQFGYTDQRGHFSPYGDFSRYALMNPYFDPYDPNGELVRYFEDGDFSQGNPLWNSTTDTRSKITGSNISEIFKAKWFVCPNWDVYVGFNYSKLKYKAWNAKPVYHTDFIDTDVKGSYEEFRAENEYIGGTLGVNYNYSFGRHCFTTSLSGNVDHSKLTILSQCFFGFSNQDLGSSDVIVVNPDNYMQADDGSTEIWRANAILQYCYDSRYYIYANYCLQNFSRVSLKKSNDGFWSLGASWSLKNEAFLINTSWISTLNIRGSLGCVGGDNDNVTDQMMWQERYDRNVGMDFLLFGNLLNGRFDFYSANADHVRAVEYNKVEEQIMIASGKTESQGYEAFLNLQILNNPQKNYFLNLFASIASHKSRMKNVSIEAGNESINLSDGLLPINALLVKASVGIDPTTGKEMFVTSDGSYTTDGDQAAIVDCGDMLPKKIGNFGLNAEFFGLGIHAVFVWDRGSMMFNNTLANRCDVADEHFNFDKRLIEYGRWTKPGDLSSFRPRESVDYENYTTRFVQKINRFSLPYLSVYYDLKNAGILKDCFLDNCKISFSMNDVYNRLQKEHKLYERGTSYPFAKTYSISLLLAF